MRRLRRSSDKERGATGVLVAVMTLVLIGAGAMAVDVGQIYAEHAQLQNAADAGAMAAMQQCHTTPSDCPDQALAWAQAMSGGNSNDGATTVDSVDLSVPNQVTVVTSTLSGSNTFLTKMFASALNAPPAKVRATATAAVEPIGGATAFPLAFSDCQYDLSGAEVTGDIQLIKYKPGSGTCTSTAGHVIPGGFGWLDQTAPCQASTSSDDIAGSDTGADYPNAPPGGAACDAIVTGWKNTILAGGDGGGDLPGLRRSRWHRYQCLVPHPRLRNVQDDRLAVRRQQLHPGLQVGGTRCKCGQCLRQPLPRHHRAIRKI